MKISHTLINTALKNRKNWLLARRDNDLESAEILDLQLKTNLSAMNEKEKDLFWHYVETNNQ